LRAGRVKPADLEAVQRRRLWPARMTQRMQLLMQNRLIAPALQGVHKPKPPFIFEMLNAVPLLQRIPARILAVGFRPEHVHTPEMAAARVT
jgi:hypothetical protein